LSFFEKFVNNIEVQKYIDYLLSQYFTFINKIGFDKPWFISTLVGKKRIHDCLLPTLKKVTGFIEKNGGKYFVNTNNLWYKICIRKRFS
jgi:hypothetical protein